MTTYYKATRPDGRDFYTGTVDYAAALDTGKRLRVHTPAQAAYACCTPYVLHASDVPTETLIGGSWPCRLFEVTGRPVAQHGRKFGFRSLAVVREVEGWRALGPQGEAIAALVERARVLTFDETRSLAAARDAARDAAGDAALAAAWAAARDAARAAAWAAARDAAGDAAWAAALAAARDAAWAAARDAAGDAALAAAWAAARDAARDAAWAAARDAAGDAALAAALAAAGALTVRDLIGDHFTQAHYDTLTRPWASVIGPAHPDDRPVA